jgi:hypothetical protein
MSRSFGRGSQPFSLRPLLHYTAATDDSPEKLIIQYARRTFTGYWGLPRSSEIPPITEAQAEALDALHFLAEKYAVSLDFRQGDIQYANNLSIFHARDGFKDSPEQQYVHIPLTRHFSSLFLIGDISSGSGFETPNWHGRLLRRFRTAGTLFTTVLRARSQCSPWSLRSEARVQVEAIKYE